MASILLLLSTLLLVSLATGGADQQHQQNRLVEQLAPIADALWQHERRRGGDDDDEALRGAAEALQRLRPASGAGATLALAVLHKEWLRAAGARGRERLLRNATALFEDGLRELGCAGGGSAEDREAAELPLLSRLAVFRGRLRCSAAYGDLLTLHQVRGGDAEAAALVALAPSLGYPNDLAPLAARVGLAVLALREHGRLGVLKPIWSADEPPLHWLRMLTTPAVVAELRGVASGNATTFSPSFQNWNLNAHRTSDWTSLSLLNKGQLDEAGCQLAPQTCALLRTVLPQLAPVVGIAEETGARLLRLAPGARLRPHFGPGGRLVAHLGVAVPAPRGSARLHVGSQVLSWEEGQLLVFDDGYLHWAENGGETARVILHLTFPNPTVVRSLEDNSRPGGGGTRELRGELLPLVAPPSVVPANSSRLATDDESGSRAQRLTVHSEPASAPPPFILGVHGHASAWFGSIGGGGHPYNDIQATEQLDLVQALGGGGRDMWYRIELRMPYPSASTRAAE